MPNPRMFIGQLKNNHYQKGCLPNSPYPHRQTAKAGYPTNFLPVCGLPEKPRRLNPAGLPLACLESGCGEGSKSRLPR
tara:strand:- start:1118 stop:1351 length:234 start_codon:yes stop_codon:yes gene_type:complete